MTEEIKAIKEMDLSFSEYLMYVSEDIRTSVQHTENISTGRQIGQIGRIYRGHCESSWRLLPNVSRENSLNHMDTLINNFPLSQSFGNDKIKTEFQLLKNFYTTANLHGLKIPDSKYFRHVDNIQTMSPTTILSKRGEWYFDDDIENIAALAQHYGVPTRMLDWTYDSDCALYFATKNAVKNLLDKKDKYAIKKLSIYLTSSSSNIDLGCPELRITTPNYYQNPNLAAQKGCFINWRYRHDEFEYLDKAIDEMIEMPLTEEQAKKKGVNKDRLKLFAKDKIFKFNILYSEVPIIWEYLLNKGCSASKYFPGYHSIVEDMNEWKMLAELKMKT
ncbi:MAG: FRG domain-containing protein [Clostridiales Family XIII bacterium]|jgi:hypothetical protein|nr:FRG domain-containing protein [Clostridiales Family XIII bacterium]